MQVGDSVKNVQHHLPQELWLGMRLVIAGKIPVPQKFHHAYLAFLLYPVHVLLLYFAHMQITADVGMIEPHKLIHLHKTKLLRRLHRPVDLHRHRQIDIRIERLIDQRKLPLTEQIG
jgi:hypothetical protein